MRHGLAVVISGGEPAIRYQLADDYLVDAGAPLTSPRTGSTSRSILTTNQFTFVQTDGQFSVANGKLVFTAQSTPNWGDQGFYSAALNRVANRVAMAKINLDQANSYCWFGWSLNAAPTNPGGRAGTQAIYFNAGTLSVISSTNTIPISAYSAGVDYEVAVVERAAGADFYIRGGAFATWTHLFASPTDSTATRALCFGSYNASGKIDYVRAWDLVPSQAAYFGWGAHPTIDYASAPNAAAFLTTPTYDGSGEATHPSVLDMGVGGWNGYRYWMAMTPYPNADNTKEQPSILVSADGNTWSVPAGGTNPIDPAFNQDSDTDLYYEAGTLYCIYRRRNQDVVLSSTTDGINWSVPVLLFTGAASAITSPSLLKIGSQYVIWSVNAAVATPYQLERRTCSTLTGTWSAPTVCTITMPTAPTLVGIWHLDVLADGGTLYAIITFQYAMYQLFLASSTDGGLTWTLAAGPVLGQTTGWDKQIYRSTMLRIAGGFDLWYGGYANGAPSIWHIGRTTITVPGL